jgi:molybdopterin-guanine dinucleotide biosynthesis protein A
MGKDKALLRLHNRYLIDYPIQVLQQLTTDVRIIGDPWKYGFLGLPVVSDCLKSNGPLSGIYTALKISPSFFNLIVGCDMPRIALSFLKLLLGKAKHGDIIMMKFEDGIVEPLCALYSKACLEAIESSFRQQQHQVTSISATVKTVYVSESEISALGLTRDIFANVNTPADLADLGSGSPH